MEMRTFDDDYNDGILVSGLVKQLNELPQDHKVVLEGCDCEGYALKATLSRVKGEVYIHRTDTV